MHTIVFKISWFCYRKTPFIASQQNVCCNISNHRKNMYPKQQDIFYFQKFSTFFVQLLLFLFCVFVCLFLFCFVFPDKTLSMIKVFGYVIGTLKHAIYINISFSAPAVNKSLSGYNFGDADTRAAIAKTLDDMFFNGASVSTKLVFFS